MTALDEPIDARKLRAFLMLAREASFASAAAALGLTPSAMSHSIKALEEEMGGELFNRRGSPPCPAHASRVGRGQLCWQ
jgi:LysR family transcriptional regulator, low CO2-responsive transcriptional regulator